MPLLYPRLRSLPVRKGLRRFGKALAAPAAVALLLPVHGAGAQVPQASAEALKQATSLVREGQYDAAISRIQRALPGDPRNARLFTVEGVAYSLKGDDTRALQALRAALKASPGFPAALKAEADILSRHHDPAAIPLLEGIVKTTPGDPVAREMLALAEAQNGQCPAALGNFGLVGPALESHPASLQQQAACLFDIRHYPEAIAAFQRLHTLEPADLGTVYDLALVQMQAGDAQAAAGTLAPVLSTTTDTDLLLLGADIAESLGDTPRAATLLRQAIVADPSHPEAYVRFAELCMAHESYDAGVDMVSAGISRMPGESSLYLARGLLYGGMAKYDKAEADFGAAEMRDPHHGTGAYAVGLVQAQRNDTAAALATVRSGLQAHPGDAQLHFLLARILLEGGARPGLAPFTEASEHAQTAVALDPRLLSAHDLLARIYMEDGQQARAVTECRAALALDSSDQTALYRLVRALRETGDAAGAHAAAQQVAEMHQKARQEESSRLRYRIEGTSTPGGSTGATPAAGTP